MNPNNWEILYSQYLLSPEYNSCLELNPESNCIDFMDEYYLMTSLNVGNDSYLEVTTIYHKVFERFSSVDSMYVQKKDLIVEGKIRGCYIASEIDKSLIRRIRGEFRIRLLSE